MTLPDLLNHVTDKDRFSSVKDYLFFCTRYLEYVQTRLQARIISQNESHYQFFQYRKEGYFNITRPLNSLLMYEAENFAQAAVQFNMLFERMRDGHPADDSQRENLVRTIYTVQQSIGAALDGLAAGKSNQARKLNGDLFERFIRLLIHFLGIDCTSGTVQVPIKDESGRELLKHNYQHDLLLSKDNELKVIGSVKTSSKDRIDKVFMDKFLYSRLTDTNIPHIAIFLNDVQRKKTRSEGKYGINATFLARHFKAYAIKLNPLDGVYYCDIRPNMKEDAFLAQHIKTIDHFFYSDIWSLLNQDGQRIENIKINHTGDIRA